MKTRFTPRILFVVLGAVSISYLPQQAFGQTKTTYKEKDLGLLPAPNAQPDLTGLWYHINEKQIKQANDEYRLSLIHI